MSGTDHRPRANEQQAGPAKWLTSAFAGAFVSLLIGRLTDLGWVQILIVGICAAGIGLATLNWQRWPLRRVILVILAPTAVIVAVIIAGVAVTTKEPADVRWYVLSQNGKPELAESDILVVQDDWVSETEARIPIRIAAGNQGEEPLQDVTVQIGYPEDYQVIPEGDQRLDAHERFLIYEHPLEDLHVEGGFAMLLKPDELVLPVLNTTFNYVKLSMDDIPVERRASIIYVGGTEEELADCWIIKEIPLDFRIFSSGDLVAEETLMVAPAPASGPGGHLRVEEIAGNRRILLSELNPVEKELLERILTTPRSWDWSASYPLPAPATPPTGSSASDDGVTTAPTGPKISFEDTDFGQARFQAVAVDDLTRKIIVDSNGDGRRDFEVIRWGPRAGNQNLYRYEDSDIPMQPWTPAMLTTSYSWECLVPFTAGPPTPPYRRQ